MNILLGFFIRIIIIIIDFPLENLILVFIYFSFYTALLSILFLQLFIFYKKSMHWVLSKCFQYSLIFGRYMHKGLIFFSIFIANEMFKIIFTKRDLVRYYYFINTNIIYQKWHLYRWNLYFSISVSSDFIILSSFFIDSFKIFNNFFNL